MRDEGDGREGGMASVLRVRPVNAPVGDSQSDAGSLLALKLAREDEPLSIDALSREAEVFQTLRGALGMPPCPRLHDVVLTDRGQPVGLVMEWCPYDMERWWAEVHLRPCAFSELCDALAEVCLRLREYQRTCALSAGQRVAHSDVKPRNLLRAQDARWLLTDFGASKSRDIDVGDWSATRVILGTESFIAPEGLFNARKSHPEAMDIWSVGATLYALLRMHAHLRDGGRMPLNGTHSSQFRSHRVALVSDLHQRKPALFIDKPLDPAQFTSPDRLPDKDRVAVAEALRDGFAPEHGVAVLDATLALLDRAMRIDPQQRYSDAGELADALSALARLARVDEGIEATRVSLATDSGLATFDVASLDDVDDVVSAPHDITGVRSLGGPPPGSRPALKPSAASSATPASASPATPASASPATPASASSAASSPTGASPASAESVAPAALSPPASSPAAGSSPAAPVAPASPSSAAAPATPSGPSAAPAGSSPAAASARQSVPPGVVTPVQRVGGPEAEGAKHVVVGGNARPAPLIVQRALEDREAPPLGEIVRDGASRSLPPAPAIPRDSKGDGVRVSRRSGSRFPAWLGVGIAVLVALQLVSIGLQITALLVSARQDAAPAPLPAPVAPVAVAAPVPLPEPKTGFVLVAGGEAYLDQIGRRVPIGAVPVGRYTLFVLPDGAPEFVDQGTVEVHADEHLLFRCSSDGCTKGG